MLELLARRLGRTGFDIVPIGGAHAIRRFVAGLGSDTRVRGLCDEREAPLFERALDDVFVCRPDLEAELIRALGAERVVDLIDDSFRTLQQQPFHRDRPLDAQVHRWLRSVSTRAHRYLPVLVEALDLDRIPEPLEQVLCV